MSLQELIAEARIAVNDVQDPEYREKYNQDKVRQARNYWHSTAVEVDTARRVAGEDSRRYTRAVEAEAEASAAYFEAKEETGILERWVYSPANLENQDG